MLDVASLFGHGSSRLRNALWNWTLSGAYTYQSAQNLTLTSQLDAGLSS